MTKYQKNKLIFLSVFSFLLLIILNNYSKNGRYILNNEHTVILDTRTGTMFFPKKTKFLEIDEYENVFEKTKQSK